MHGTLRNLHCVAEGLSQGRAFTGAYLDDTYFVLPVGAAQPMLAQCERVFHEVGVDVKLVKTSLWLPPGAHPPPGWPARIDSSPSVLGARLPVGVLAMDPSDWQSGWAQSEPSLEAVAEHRRALADRLAILIEAGLSRQNAFALARIGTSGDATYHLRAVLATADERVQLDNACV